VLKSVFVLGATLSFTLAMTVLAATPNVAVEGLLPNAAVLNVDGQRKMLRVGQSFRGVTLKASDGSTATIEVEGKRMQLGLSQYIGSNYAVPKETVVTIPRNDHMQYLTNASINGRTASVLVDTGANIVALSEAHALTLGIKYKEGQRSVVQTASGVVNSRLVTLRSVDVGGIKVDNVQASVIEGSHPDTILLGMSYLRHVKLSEQNGILTLSRVR
jgi:aspartyl protease family protein